MPSTDSRYVVKLSFSVENEDGSPMFDQGPAGGLRWSNVPYIGVVQMEEEVLKMLQTFNQWGFKAAAALGQKKF
jgi:hypothetical protein